MKELRNVRQFWRKWEQNGFKSERDLLEFLSDYFWSTIRPEKENKLDTFPINTLAINPPNGILDKEKLVITDCNDNTWNVTCEKVEA